jgi:diguanylate cyclase (GGDEF)-like protein/PAS domain S-box-containing protein
MRKADRLNSSSGQRGEDTEEGERALREISIIAEIGRIIGSSLEIDEIYSRFCVEVRKLVPFDRLVINVHDIKKGMVRVAYVCGTAQPGRGQGNVFPLPGTISGYVAEHRIGICHLSDSFPFSDCVTAMKDNGMQSLMAIPLISRDEVVASLHFRSEVPDIYGEEELSVAQRIGAQITGAIANSLLYADLKKTEELLEKSEDLYRTFVSNASDIILKTDEKGFLTFVNPAALRVTGYEEGELVGANYLEIVRPDKREEAAMFLGIQFVKKIKNTYIELPITAKDGSEVWLGQNVQLIFDEGRVTGFQAVSRDVTDRRRVEEALKESEEKYRALSIVDGLTGLFNSRHFHEVLEEERSRAGRYNQPLTLVMMDIDDFKAFNDTYGHVEGDGVLARFGKIVKNSLRKADAAFRYGGEEFTILLPMTFKNDGVLLAERIRAGFASEAFLPVFGIDVHMTISLGVAQLHEEETAKEFIERADAFMYNAKKSGKNRVVVEP